MNFFNSSGNFTFDEMIKSIEEFVFDEKVLGNEVRLLIGTDSQQVGKRRFLFAIAVAVHSVGNGGTFFIHREKKDGFYHLSERLFEEANMSLEIANKLKGNSFIDMIDAIEVHADVGYNGESRKYAQAIKAMIEGYGFKGYIKPEAPAATHIADNFLR